MTRNHKRSSGFHHLHAAKGNGTVPDPGYNRYSVLEKAAPLTIQALPTELLEQICQYLDTAIDPEKVKDQFLALRAVSSRFAFLDTTRRVLFREVHICTTPNSTTRLAAIAQDGIRKFVRKLTFHRPALDLRDDLLEEYQQGHPTDSKPWIVDSPKRRVAVEAYISAYFTQMIRLGQRKYEESWASAISHFPKASTIEITGSPRASQFSTAGVHSVQDVTKRAPGKVPERKLPHESNQSAWLPCDLVDWCNIDLSDFDSRGNGTTAYMKRLYRGFCGSYAVHSEWYGSDKHTIEESCARFLSTVLRTAERSGMALRKIRIGDHMGFCDDFDWSPFRSALTHLESAEVALIQTKYWSEDAKSDVAARTLVANAPRLDRLRFLDGLSRLDTFQDLPTIHQMLLAPSLGVKGASVHALRQLELVDIAVDPDFVISLLAALPSLEYLSLGGDFWHARTRGLNDMFDAMSNHGKLADCDFDFFTRYLHFRTRSEACQCMSAPCRTCRDIRKVKYDIFHKAPWPSWEPVEAPCRGWDWAPMEPAATVRECWECEIERIRSKLCSLNSFYIGWGGDDDLPKTELQLREKRKEAEARARWGNITEGPEWQRV